jgi:curved DNA-binding protein CbpA
MSAPVSGKFQDHYFILGIDPKADSETIQGAYAKLSQKYHPNNRDTGDAEKFAAVNLAFEVLSDPSLRITFDQLKGVDHEGGNPKFTGVDFFHALEHGTVLRAAVLCILYDRRRTKSFKPSLSMRHLEGMLHVTAEDLNFALWYLKQRGLVASDDKSNMEITVGGMDHLEQNRPSAEAVMPLIKESSLADPKLPSEKPPAASLAATPPAKAGEPVLNVLNRAIKRSLAAEEVNQ